MWCLPGQGSLPRELCRHQARCHPSPLGPGPPGAALPPASSQFGQPGAVCCLKSEGWPGVPQGPGSLGQPDSPEVPSLAGLESHCLGGGTCCLLWGPWSSVLFLQTPHTRLALPVDTSGVAWSRTLGLSPQSASQKVRPPQGQEEAHMAIQLIAGQTSPKPICDHHRVPSEDMPTRTKPNPTPGGTTNRGLSLPNNSPHSPNTAQRSPPPGSLP